MGLCVVCDTELREDGLCEDCRQKEVTIGIKEMDFYLCKIINKGVVSNRIIIKGFGSRLEKFEITLAPKLALWGLRETGRVDFIDKGMRDGNPLNSTIIIMDMFPPLRGLKVDARRKKW